MTGSLRVPVVVLLAMLLQLTVLDLLRVRGASPDMSLALAASAGIVAGAHRGAIVGFMAGLAIDLVASSAFGLAALTATLVGYSVGAAEDSVVRSSRWLPPLVLAAAGAIGTLTFAALGELLGRVGAITDDVLVRALVVGAWNGALALPLVPLVRWAMRAPSNLGAQR